MSAGEASSRPTAESNGDGNAGVNAFALRGVRERMARPPYELTAHALRRIAQRDDRVLRVIYNDSVDPPKIVTAYFDRRQRDKP